MKAATRALLAAVVFVALAFGLLGWSVWYNRAKAEEMEKKILSKLTEEDLKLILQSEAQGNPQQLAALKNDPEQRKEILEGVKGLLAQAAAARREGLADDPKIKAQIELQGKIILARLYDQQKNEGKPAPPFGTITQEELNQYWSKPEHEAEFQKAIDMETAQMKAAGQQVPKIEGETLKRAKESFGRLMVTYEKAKADADFMNKREVQLQISLQQALLLAREYSEKVLAKKVEPTKEEIAKYLAEHPEYDQKKQREKAEQVLQRAKNGEDFAALAKEFSEDPGSKDKGGLYEDISQGEFVPEFEQAAFALEPGQIAPNLVESQFGYHIIKLEKKGVGKNQQGKEGPMFSARHILINSKFPAPNSNPFGRPQMMTGEEIARAKIGEEKRKKVMEELIAKNHIELPEDFTVEVPQGAEQMNPQVPRMPPGMEMDDGHGHDKKDDKPAPKGKESAKPKQKQK